MAGDLVEMAVVQTVGDQFFMRHAQVRAGVFVGAAKGHGQKGLLLGPLAVHVGGVEKIRNFIIHQDLAVKQIDCRLNGAGPADTFKQIVWHEQYPPIVYRPQPMILLLYNNLVTESSFSRKGAMPLLHVSRHVSGHISGMGQLILEGRRYRCALGRGGIAGDKREGDGVTPAGQFPFRGLLYRADRLARPDTGLAAQVIKPSDGWCDDPTDSAYNLAVTLPHGAGAERLWRDDHLYDLVVIMGHNDNPVVRGLGSAIFMHVAGPAYGPTEGCVALAREDLLAVLRKLDTNSEILIEI